MNKKLLILMISLVFILSLAISVNAESLASDLEVTTYYSPTIFDYVGDTSDLASSGYCYYNDCWIQFTSGSEENTCHLIDVAESNIDAGGGWIGLVSGTSGDVSGAFFDIYDEDVCLSGNVISSEFVSDVDNVLTIDFTLSLPDEGLEYSLINGLTSDLICDGYSPIGGVVECQMVFDYSSFFLEYQTFGLFVSLNFYDGVEYVDVDHFYRYPNVIDYFDVEWYDNYGCSGWEIVGFYGNIFDEGLVIPSVFEGEIVCAVGEEVFMNKGFSGFLDLPNTLVEVKSLAFTGNTWGNLVLPDSLVSISTAFQYGTFTGVLVLPNSLTTIVSQAFGDSGLSGGDNLIIPASVTSITGSRNFAYMSVPKITFVNPDITFSRLIPPGDVTVVGYMNNADGGGSVVISSPRYKSDGVTDNEAYTLANNLGKTWELYEPLEEEIVLNNQPYEFVNNLVTIEFSNITGTIEVDDIQTDGVSWVYVNPSSAANVPASITFNNVPVNKIPYRNGKSCSGVWCSDVLLDSNILSFDVVGFSNYSYGEDYSALFKGINFNLEQHHIFFNDVNFNLNKHFDNMEHGVYEWELIIYNDSVSLGTFYPHQFYGENYLRLSTGYWGIYHEGSVDNFNYEYELTVWEPSAPEINHTFSWSAEKTDYSGVLTLLKQPLDTYVFFHGLDDFWKHSTAVFDIRDYLYQLSSAGMRVEIYDYDTTDLLVVFEEQDGWVTLGDKDFYGDFTNVDWGTYIAPGAFAGVDSFRIIINGTYYDEYSNSENVIYNLFAYPELVRLQEFKEHNKYFFINEVGEQNICFDLREYYSGFDDFNLTIKYYDNESVVYEGSRGDIDNLPNGQIIDLRDGFCGSESIGFRIVEDLDNEFDFLIEVTVLSEYQSLSDSFRMEMIDDQGMIYQYENFEEHYEYFITEELGEQNICFDLRDYFINLDDFYVEFRDFDTNTLEVSGSRGDISSNSNGQVIDLRDGFCGQDSVGFRIVENLDYEFDYLINLTAYDYLMNEANAVFRMQLIDDHVRIYTCQDLLDLDGQLSDWERTFIVLEDDLYCAGESITGLGYLSGSFDGQGYVIHDLTIEGESKGFLNGIAGGMGGETIVKDLGFYNLTYNSTLVGQDTGALIGGINGEGIVERVFLKGGEMIAHRGGTITGVNSGVIRNVYSSMNMNVFGSEWHGGLVGVNYGTVETSYFNGELNDVMGDCALGNMGNGASSVFYNSDKCVSAIGEERSTGLSDTNMKYPNLAHFYNEGFDFGTIWGANDEDNNAYPFLRWEGYENEYVLFVFEVTVENAFDEYWVTIWNPVDLVINWGDGSSDLFDEWGFQDGVHVYEEPGVYNVSVSGEVYNFRVGSLVTDVFTSPFDTLTLSSAEGLFANTQFETVSSDINSWNITVSNLGGLFSNSLFNQDISGWDVSGVTDMGNMFGNAPFNQDISGWDVSNVENMAGLFSGYLNQFNQDISGWNVSGVKSMSYMFSENTVFDQDISGWDVSNVEDMSGMFYYSTFSKDLGAWNTSSVTNMDVMFTYSGFGASDVNIMSSATLDRISGNGFFVSQRNNIRDGSTASTAIIWGDTVIEMAWSEAQLVDRINYYYSYVPYGAYDYEGYSFQVYDVVAEEWVVVYETLDEEFLQWVNIEFDAILTDKVRLHSIGEDIFIRQIEVLLEDIETNIGQWDVSNVESMNSMFSNSVFNQDISSWNTSGVTNMDYMFYHATMFDQDISSWCVVNIAEKPEEFDTNSGFAGETLLQPNWGNCGEPHTVFGCMDDRYANYDPLAEEDDGSCSGWLPSYCTEDVSPCGGGCPITDFTGMFTLYDFDSDVNEVGDITGWDVSCVTSMVETFSESNFNQDIGGWDVSAVTSFEATFADSYLFNQPLGSWNVSSAQNMRSMFAGTSFDQDISAWNTSGVTNMLGMFEVSSFNQPLNNWDVSNVEDMSGMFSSSDFNQPIGSWDVSNVEEMSSMFANSVFNQPIGSWNTSSLTSAPSMFYGASSFYQDISGWCVTNIETKPTGFDTDSAFEGEYLLQPNWGTCGEPHQVSPGIGLSSDKGWTVDYGETVTITGIDCPIGLTCTLYRQGSEVSNPNVVSLDVGSYTYVFNTSGNVDYFAESVSQTLVVQSVAGNVNLRLNGVDLDAVLTYGDALNVSAWSNTGQPVTILLNGTDISGLNNLNQFLNAGSYNVTVIAGETLNHDEVSMTRFVTVNKASPVLSLSNAGGGSIFVGADIDVLGNGCPSGVVCALYLDGDLVSNPFTDALDVGSYLFVFNTTGNDNYEAASVSYALVVNDLPNTFQARGGGGVEEAREAEIIEEDELEREEKLIPLVGLPIPSVEQALVVAVLLIGAYLVITNTAASASSSARAKRGRRKKWF